MKGSYFGKETLHQNIGCLINVGHLEMVALTIICTLVQFIITVGEFKVALSFPINTFHKKNRLGKWHTSIMINASNEGICVEF